jgi:hypothetical protein
MPLTKHQAAIRAAVEKDCRWLVAHQLIEGYDEARPYARPPYPPTSTFRNDCTGTIKLVLCDWNTIPSIDGDPSGYGNTRTFAESTRMWTVPHGRPWQPLDILLYKEHSGPFVAGPGEHATMLVWKDKDGLWWVFSHGSASGPKFLPWNYRGDFAMARRIRIPAK